MANSSISIPAKYKRTFLPDNLEINSWESLKSFFDDLAERKIQSVSDLENWIHDSSELNTIMAEDCGWRYIHSSCDTTNQQYKDAYTFYVSVISPNAAPYDDLLNRKLLDSPFLQAFLDSISKDRRVGYEIYLKKIKKHVEIYREENIPLQTWLSNEEQKYAEIAGAMSIEMNGKEITLQQAAVYLKEPDRKLREEVYYKINNRRIADRDTLDTLFSSLVKTRNKIALNSGFKNYRDYSFAAMGRFDYTPEDCFAFHDAIAEEILPLCNAMNENRSKALQVNPLKPWDMEVDPTGKPALKPFSGGEELMNKTIACFYKINPFLGNCMEILKAMNHVDLESRKGKAPGGYNYPLYESGVPFIFMNAANTMRDVITIVHEGGHAVHSIVTNELEYIAFKDTPSEVAELASMSMELISMEHWNEFLPSNEDVKTAKKQQLQKAISILPWIALVDKFQHWIYLNPEHSVDERNAAWTKMQRKFESNVIDRSGQEKYLQTAWHSQLHIFQIPFYYIEYGMAQLGAIAVWRNYKKDPEKALSQYLDALKLGYTKPIGEIYKTAGVKFDFSKEYIKELADFLKSELALLG